ncbi:MAG: hypothetical protein IT318_19630 [Anaerolineales bacterium]|nr:hypothetical protein [Anaerolineales bacterium]
MDLAQIKAAYGDRLCFHGGGNITQTLPRSTPAEVRERAPVLGAGGGFILCSSHHQPPDMPVTNALAKRPICAAARLRRAAASQTTDVGGPDDQRSLNWHFHGAIVA